MARSNRFSGNRPTMKAGDVVWVPIQSIKVRHDWFQGRATPYSERSVANIIEAAQTGGFRWSNLDPVTLWLDHTGKLFMLSGHSRLEAFNRLCAGGATAAGKNFCEIPAKIESDISLEQAKRIALESNTLSTKESALERAAYYSRLRAQGMEEKALQAQAKRLEGRDYTTVLAYSYLNPHGKTYTALQALEKSAGDSNDIINRVARWIGNARRAFPLTNSHENELYDWLITRKGYGTGRGQVSNEREFKERLMSIINRRTQFGVLDDSLNIQAFLQRSPVEQQYNAQLEAARQEAQQIERDLRAKVKELIARGATESQVQEITAGLEASLRRARIRYQELLGRRGEVAEAARNEMSLFAGMGRILPPAIGKVVDYPKNKPGSRADQYWGGLTTPDQIGKFVRKFSLHSIEFGNWVRTGEREAAFQDFSESLATLAKVMNVPQRNIGFNGKLSVSFGSRGRGGRALATYHPGIHHINITKPRGRGSLAHEYGHSLDFFAGRKQVSPPSGGKSTSFRIQPKRGIAGLFQKVFRVLYYKEDGTMTSFAESLSGYTDYWRSREEVWARTFEAWVGWQARKKGISTPFLHSKSYGHAVYPDARLLKKADPFIRQIITKIVGR